MSRQDAPPTRTRRRFAAGLALAALGVGSGCVESSGSTPSNASSGGAAEGGTEGGTDDGTEGADGGTADPSVLGGYLSDALGYDGTIADRRGRDEVRVSVGVPVEGYDAVGPNAFDPPAVHVDAGTTVVWEWTGDGSHDVVAEDGTFDSGGPTHEDGHTFERVFETDGVYRYRCRPHRSLGMKGAVVVGDDYEAVTPSPTETPPPDVVPGSADRTFDGWLDPVDDYRGVVDLTDRSEVSVAVLASGGEYRFTPPAIRVEAGTTVAWQWPEYGGAGGREVVAVPDTDAVEDGAWPPEDPAFASERVGEPGHAFSHTFTETGVYPYACGPHLAIGMRGVVEVV